MHDYFDDFDDWDNWHSWDEVVYDSLDSVHVEEEAMDCYAYYGENSHISINGSQPQPLDDELWQPADLVEVFRNVSVIHMTDRIEEAIDILRDVRIAANSELAAGVDSVVCGRLGIRFPAISWNDVQHYLESVA